MKYTEEILFKLLRRALYGEEIPRSSRGMTDESSRGMTDCVMSGEEIPRSSRGMTEESSRGMTDESSRGMTEESSRGMTDCDWASHSVEQLTAEQWREIYQMASYQGVLGVLWDGVKDLPMEKGLKFNWALNVEKIEKKYERQRVVLEELAQLFSDNGMDMMVIKGYGLSLLYPQPNHRPCGDIDFYLYGDYEKGDKVLEETHNLTTELNHHHHTVNFYKGVMLENHYDFLNIEAHLSNKIIEQRLIDAVNSDKGDRHELSNGYHFYSPCPEFNALFLLRHAAAHFAAERIGLRHLIDWALFINHYGEKVNWDELYKFSREMNMHLFLNCINTIAIEQLGVNPDLLPQYKREPKLEKRVLQEILSPAFKTPMPKKGNPMIYIWKLRRWTGNIWKNKIVYREGLLNQFFVLWMSHIFKPTLKNDR